MPELKIEIDDAQLRAAISMYRTEAAGTILDPALILSRIEPFVDRVLRNIVIDADDYTRYWPGDFWQASLSFLGVDVKHMAPAFLFSIETREVAFYGEPIGVLVPVSPTTE